MGRTQPAEPAPFYPHNQYEPNVQPQEYQHGAQTDGPDGITPPPYEPPLSAQPQFQQQYLPQSPQPVPFPPPNPGGSNGGSHHQPPSHPPQSNYPPPQSDPVAFPPEASPPSFHHQPNAAAFQSRRPPHYQAAGYPGKQPSPVPVVSTPMGMPVPAPTFTQPWNTGLFDCMDDPKNAIITACFPCLTFGQIAEIVDNGSTTCGTSGLLYGVIAFFIGLPCLMSCTYRTKLRNRYGLLETPAPDWLTHCCCEWCALCQEYRELQHRGLDPSIGWLGNVARNQQLQKQQVAMMPPMNQTMMG